MSTPQYVTRREVAHLYHRQRREQRELIRRAMEAAEQRAQTAEVRIARIEEIARVNQNRLSQLAMTLRATDQAWIERAARIDRVHSELVTLRADMMDTRKTLAQNAETTVRMETILTGSRGILETLERQSEQLSKYTEVMVQVAHVPERLEALEKLSQSIAQQVLHWQEEERKRQERRKAIFDMVRTLAGSKVAVIAFGAVATSLGALFGIELVRWLEVLIQ